MPRLLNRQKQIPYNYQFYDPVIKWTAHRGSSFQVICDGLLTARLANPGLTASKGLSTDKNAIADEVDFFNASICERMGWTDFITGGSGGPSPVPFPQPARVNPLRNLKNAVVGSEVIVEWIASGAEAVPQEQANRRAEICSRCPLNEQGGWERWFTLPVSNAIRTALGHKKEFKLETPFDDKLHTCTACSCPMALKVFVPFEKFYPKMSQSQRDALNKENPTCWIIIESQPK